MCAWNWKHAVGLMDCQAHFPNPLTVYTIDIHIWLYIWSSRSGVWATPWWKGCQITELYREIDLWHCKRFLLGLQVWTHREIHLCLSFIHSQEKKKKKKNLYNSRLQYTFCNFFTHEGCIVLTLVLWKSTAPETAVTIFFLREFGLHPV